MAHSQPLQRSAVQPFNRSIAQSLSRCAKRQLTAQPETGTPTEPDARAALPARRRWKSFSCRSRVLCCSREPARKRRARASASHDTSLCRNSKSERCLGMRCRREGWNMYLGAHIYATSPCQPSGLVTPRSLESVRYVRVCVCPAAFKLFPASFRRRL